MFGIKGKVQKTQKKLEMSGKVWTRKVGNDPEMFWKSMEKLEMFWKRFLIFECRISFCRNMDILQGLKTKIWETYGKVRNWGKIVA